VVIVDASVPLSDLAIAALALEYDCQVYALDPHFEQIPDLKLHTIPRPPRHR
jgi:predicted nucleic acid-binding protein